MKKIIALLTLSMFMAGGIYAQSEHQHGQGQGHGGKNCENCPHHHQHHGQHGQQAPQQPQAPQYNADGIDMAIVKAFPTVKSIKKASKWTEVYDANQHLLGYALYSKPASDGIKGYNGETPLLIAFTPKKVILGVWLLGNVETPKFAQRVQDAGFYNNWNGLTIKQAKKKKVDTVSGATFTSRAVEQSLQAALGTL